MKAGPPLVPGEHETLATGSLASTAGVQVVLIYGGATPALLTQAAAKPAVSRGFVQVVLTCWASVVVPTTQAGDAVAGWLFGPTGCEQLVVIQLGAPLELEPIAHGATGVDVLFPAGKVQVRT